MVTIKCRSVATEKPFKGLSCVQRHLSLVQFKHDESVIAFCHALVVCVKHSFPCYVEVGHKNDNWKKNNKYYHYSCFCISEQAPEPLRELLPLLTTTINTTIVTTSLCNARIYHKGLFQFPLVRNFVLCRLLKFSLGQNFAEILVEFL